MLAEMTDETNMARAFALIPLTWATGATAGYESLLFIDRLPDQQAVVRPYVGGLLSRPHDRWPDIFSHSFWTQYPYFLPCAVASVYGVASVIVASIFLKEVGARS
jgi:hypothetical protein